MKNPAAARKSVIRRSMLFLKPIAYTDYGSGPILRKADVVMCKFLEFADESLTRPFFSFMLKQFLEVFMDMGFIVELVILAVVVIQFIVMILLFSRNRHASQTDLTQRLLEYSQRLEKNESTLRDEFGKNREETNKAAKESREELSSNLNSVSGQLYTTIKDFTGLVDNKMKTIQEFLDSGLKSNREELNNSINAFEKKVSTDLSAFSEALNNGLTSVQDRLSNSMKESREGLTSSLKSFEGESSAKIEALTKETIKGLESNRAIVDAKLAEIQKNNDEKLEKMRETVEEKLQKTLESRIGESFKQVSENLERVQKGLGEMQNLATDVGGLKNVLTNVRNRGTFGEFQLGNIIEEMLNKSQYEEQVLIKPGSKEKVDYAIKIPSKEDDGGFIWLPIDAKFPTADYDRLITAYNNADKTEIEKSIKALADTIKAKAKDISTKYIDSPHTTEFAIMFLPFESLYAEVLRVPGLLQTIQTEYKITIAGPTTISAFLTSLQMGFKTLTVNERTGEISKLLSAVKQEFSQFEVTFKKAKQKIDSAGKYLEDKIGVRTRKMASKLKKVDALPVGETRKLLEISEDDDDEDDEVYELDDEVDEDDDV